MTTDTRPPPTDDEIAALRSEFGITSNGRGIKEFTQVRDFARAILAKWGTPPAVEGDRTVSHKAQSIPGVQWQCGPQASGFTVPQADSVTAPAAGAVAHTLSDAQIEAMPVWRNFVGLWPESRREIVDAVVDLLTTPPAQATDSVLEDAARYRYLRDVPMDEWPDELAIAFRLQQNAIWDTAIDAARKQGENHD